MNSWIIFILFFVTSVALLGAAWLQKREGNSKDARGALIAALFYGVPAFVSLLLIAARGAVPVSTPVLVVVAAYTLVIGIVFRVAAARRGDT